ncbi:MAG: hypothetical protein HDR06_10310 [Lachnospiraceae bacterium]|nr:hypothetical protein [Lachnospiraceae bacterium]
MNKIKKFLNSIYLGDRFCEKMDISDDKIYIQINCISRIEEGTEEWNYYSQKDIKHGYLVFDGVCEYCFSTNLLFNDEIYEICVINKEDDIYDFIVYGNNISNEAVSTDLELRIKAREFYIIDPIDNSQINE